MILYEEACFARGTADGDVVITHPELKAIIQNMLKGGSKWN